MEAETLPTSGIVVHIWPGRWDLPSFDPHCLATVLYLQLAIPGKFNLVECANPDSSPTGQLPFLVHGQYSVASFGGIVKYVSGLRNEDYKTYPDANLDVQLTASERAQKTAWVAHAESHLGDLVFHTLYANGENWVKMTHPALASMFPVPQKYYVPRRMRNSYYPRLVAAGLWRQVVEEEKPKKEKFPRDVKPAEREKLSANTTLSQAFDKEKVQAKASYELDIYSDFLDGKTFVFQNKLSTVDIVVAAHILLLLYPPFSDPMIKDLLTESYPTLLTHARKVHALALGSNASQLSYEAPSSSLWAIIPTFPKSSSSKSKKPEETPEDLQFRRMRWGFVGAALGSLVAYGMLMAQHIEIVRIPAADSNEGNEGLEEEEDVILLSPEEDSDLEDDVDTSSS